MPYIENLDDIVEELADKFGVYGTGPVEGEHPADCKCRICFCGWLKGRIEKAGGRAFFERVEKISRVIDWEQDVGEWREMKETDYQDFKKEMGCV